MTVYDVWKVCPQSHVFLVLRDKDSQSFFKVEYTGTRKYSNFVVSKLTSKVYPMFKSVIELELV